jgi:DNA processing protein
MLIPMTEYPTSTYTPAQFPSLLREIADPPTQLYVRGTYPDQTLRFLTVIGSRKYTEYGKRACETLIAGLAGYPIVIVSGLALGIDGIAHEAALRAGLSTIAVPGSGLDERVLYPATHRALARRILSAGGALVSELEPMERPHQWTFPRRNRIMVGLSHAVLVIEAEVPSGTLITSRLAAEYNRDVLAVPGPITSPTSNGSHMLIKRGAALIERSADILEALTLTNTAATTRVPDTDLPLDEQAVLAFLTQPHSRDEVIRHLGQSTSATNVLLASLELKGHVVERLGLLERVQ